ncbi:peptidylprolyl isomerase [Gordonia hydrophobica]|uniref:Peptidylprolyl isomerase n=1 Tax=Gordonia hydrophobica TaxID=40516 RepID=A0ABZ2U3A4_9ACTN|nr:peptidylprolyl isomerase [Gordonia hydrophobica]MBM7367805.1 peptidyl-prolyl cis-trans isomerase B (cyclophilin B) [Gordonia hydrophobica]
MSSNEERRDAARRKLEERLESERRAARQRRLTVISLCSVAVLAAVAVGGYFYYRHWDDQRHTACEYTKSPDNWVEIIKSLEQRVNEAPADKRADAEKYLAFVREASKKGGTSPMPADRTLNTGTVDWTLNTGLGAIPITLDRSSAPCNVNAVISLTQNHFYDGTDCYRLTKANGANLLQCGDPTRIGAGGPGWTSPDENPTGLKDGDVSPQMLQMGMTPPQIYPRGTVAIINQNDEQQGLSHTGSSRFMIVTKDSPLPSPFAIVGKVSDDGMKIVDKVVAGGIDPGLSGTADNGDPKTPLDIKTATISE